LLLLPSLSQLFALTHTSSWLTTTTNTNNTTTTTNTSVKHVAAEVPSMKLHVGSINDKAKLAPFFEGVDYLFLMTCAGPFWTETTKAGVLAKLKTLKHEELVKNADIEYEQGKTAIDLAKTAGIKHIVFSSRRSSDKVSGGKFKLPHTEGKARVSEYLKQSGVAYTIVHIALSLEAMCHFFPLQVKGDGFKITIPMGDAPLPLIAITDVGQAVHTVFTNASKWQGKTVPLLAENKPVAEYAKTLSKALGKTVVYEPESIEEFEKHAVLPNAGKAFQYMQEFPDKEACVDVTKQLIPRLTTTEAWAKAHVDVLTGKAACSDWECNTVKA
jgi:uncharacterized protein YbjT (DUF2867 family)